MKKIKQILLVLAIVIGASMSLPSCGGDDNGTDVIILDGLWEITDIISEEEEPATEDNEPGDDTTAGDGDAGAGSPPAKTEGNSQAEIIDDFGYIRFDLNTYAYFTVEGQTITTHSAGTYILSGKTLTLKEAGSADQAVVAMIDLKGNQLIMEMVFEDGSQTWHAQKMANDPFLDNGGDGTEYIDFENEVHKSDSVPGSLWNPDVIGLNQTISGTLDTLISLEAYKAEQFYYLKVDSAKTYQLTVNVFDPVYHLPAEFVEYVQVWISHKPFENNYKAEDTRIKSGTETFYNLQSPTGYLYIRLFSYQNEIDFELTLTEQEEQEQD